MIKLVKEGKLTFWFIAATHMSQDNSMLLCNIHF